MSITAVSQSLHPIANQSLGALDKILDKLAAHCELKKIDPAVFLSARLAPDMFAFTRQVQIACDFAKGAAARLSGQEVPSWSDNEATIAELKARIAKTLAFVNGVSSEALAQSDSKIMRIKLGRNAPETEMPGVVYLTSVVLPNLYFHATTAYAILRHNGVEIGKNDFLGRV